jgi:hypothetical protein
MWIVRHEPQRVVREPMSEVATPYVGDLRECADTGTACEAPDVETGQFDELFAMGVRVDLTHGGQHSCGCGCADARQLQQQLEVPTRLQSLESLREPHGLCGQSVSEIVRQGFDRKLVDTVGVSETNTLSSQVIHVLQLLGGPLATATTGLPLLQEAPAAMASDGFWRWMSQQNPQSGGLRQLLEQRMQLRKREVQSGAQLVAQWAAPFLQGHVPPHQAGGGRACRITGNGQKELARRRKSKRLAASFSSV